MKEPTFCEFECLTEQNLQNCQGWTSLIWVLSCHRVFHVFISYDILTSGRPRQFCSAEGRVGLYHHYGRASKNELINPRKFYHDISFSFLLETSKHDYWISFLCLSFRLSTSINVLCCICYIQITLPCDTRSSIVPHSESKGTPALCGS